MRRARTNHRRWQRSLWLSLVLSENTNGFFFLPLRHHLQRLPLEQQPLPHRHGRSERLRRISMFQSFGSSPPGGNSPDFYKVLNVPRTATPAQIKQAYRSMAKKYHPDANPNFDSTLAFQQVNRAYEVLSDPQLRDRYDQYGPASLGTSAASDARATASSSKSQSGSSSTSTTSIPVDNPFGPNNPNFHANPWSQRSTPFQYDNFVPDAQWMDGSGVTDGAFGPAGNSFSPNTDVLRDRSFYRGGGGASFFNDNSKGYNMGDDLQVDLDIALETAVLGGTETILINHLETCEACHGRGRTMSSCPTCRGVGFIMDLKQTSYGSLQSQRPCPTCRASAENVVCRACGGYGTMTKSKQVTVHVPPGVESFTRLRIRGQGHAGIKGGRPGDLFLFLHILPHPVFTRDGTTIRSNVTINYIDAILGATLETSVIGGAVATFEVPPGTQEGDNIILEGFGGRSLIGETNGARGQHIITAHISIPEELLEDEKATLLLLQELQADRANPNQFQPGTVSVPTATRETKEQNVASNFFAKVLTIEEVGVGGTIRVDKFEKKYVDHDSEDQSKSAISDEEVYRIDDVEEVFAGYSNDRIQIEQARSSAFQYSEDDAERPYFVARANNEFDPSRDLVNSPVQEGEGGTQESERRQQDIQEAEEVVARELEKLKDLLYAPIASTAKATKLKEDKLKRIKEAEDLVANEMAKLQELLNAPLESTAATRMKVEKERRKVEGEQGVNANLDKLRDSVYSPVEATESLSIPQNGNSEGIRRKEELERADELDKMSKVPPDQVEANGGASSTFVTQADRTGTPFLTGPPRQTVASSSSTTLPRENAVPPIFSGTEEMTGFDRNGSVNGFGLSSQPKGSVSSTSGLGEGVSIAAEGIRINSGNGSTYKPDDDKPAGPQVASQALSASVVAGKRTKVSPVYETPTEARRIATDAKKERQRQRQPNRQSSSAHATVITDVTARSILEDNDDGSTDLRKPAPARRMKHGKESSASPAPLEGAAESEKAESEVGGGDDLLDEIGPTIERRRGNSDEDTRFDKPNKRSMFEEDLFSVFKL